MRSARIVGLELITCVALAGCASSSPAGSSTPSVPGRLESSATTSALYKETIDSLWASVLGNFPSAKRPQTAIVRSVTPSEWAPVMAACLTDAGFATEVKGDSISTGTVPADQQGSLQIANYVCMASYPWEDRYLLPADSARIDRLYDYWTGDLTECLERGGYVVEAAPSRQRFHDTYGTVEQWSPYNKVSPADEAAWLDINATCPQTTDQVW